MMDEGSASGESDVGAIDLSSHSSARKGEAERGGDRGESQLGSSASTTTIHAYTYLQFPLHTHTHLNVSNV